MKQPDPSRLLRPPAHYCIGLPSEESARLLRQAWLEIHSLVAEWLYGYSGAVAPIQSQHSVPHDAPSRNSDRSSVCTDEQVVAGGHGSLPPWSSDLPLEHVGSVRSESVGRQLAPTAQLC